MPCFFVDPTQIADERVVVLGDDVRHILLCLRMKAGERITVFDGSGAEYEAELVRIRPERVEARIVATRPPQEPNFRLTLVQSLPKGKEKSDFVVQRATEIGVNKVVFTYSTRVVSKLDAAQLDNRVQRWQRLARESAKVARRPTIMPVEVLPSLEDVLSTLLADCPVIVPWEGETARTLRSAMNLFNNRAAGAIIVGPEGGFDPSEIEFLSSQGAVTVSLGPRIIRTEMAGIITAAIVLYEMER